MRLPVALTLLALAHVSNAWVPYKLQSPRDLSQLWLTTKNKNDATPSVLPTLSLYNSLTRTKEAFQPLDAPLVRLYTCGPTVYDAAHIGNFRAFLSYDIVKRVLLYLGYDVDHVCNLTDVDDKIINRANELGIDVTTLTRKYEDLFLEDLAALNIVPAGRYPRATEHIDEMMQMIQELADKGLAYETEDGSWYFAVDKQPGYGQQLVNLNFDEMAASERNEAEGKRYFADFCLWKAFKPGIDRDDAAWESPTIQRGRPGWHLECSAMARRYLGPTIDLHGGGVDLQFPHHENEIAQSRGANGVDFCRCWFHNGFVNIGDEKMSKSLGNFLTLRAACPTPLEIRAYRYLVVSSHYRNPLSFTSAAMKAAANAISRMDKVRRQIQEALKGQATQGSSVLADELVPSVLADFEAAIVDDLSMPRASAALFSLVKAAENEFKAIAKDASRSLDLVGLQAILAAMDQMDRVFGIFYQVPALEGLQQDDNAGDEDTLIPDEVMTLVEQRSAAKQAKDWELADSLRARITELGFVVKDVKGGEPIVSRVE